MVLDLRNPNLIRLLSDLSDIFFDPWLSAHLSPLDVKQVLQSDILSDRATLYRGPRWTNIVFVLIALIDEVRRGNNNTISSVGWSGRLAMMKINYSMQTL